jgi:hypothetical protein
MSRSRRPPIKLPPGVIEQIYANIGLCYQCGARYEKCVCNPTPARLPYRELFPGTLHATPPDYDSPDQAAQAENNRIAEWFDEHWATIPEIPF